MTEAGLLVQLPGQQPFLIETPKPEVKQPQPKPKNAVDRYGVRNFLNDSNPLRLLTNIQRWAQELVYREGGGKSFEADNSYGYTLKEAQQVMLAMSQTLYEFLEKTSGKLRSDINA
jgi:hypothetical protein